MNIKDVIISDLKIIKDERGKVMHMMRKDSKVFKNFGEIYFSTIYKDKIKGFYILEATLNYVCLKGKVKLVLFDDREVCSTKSNFEEIILSPEKYFLITIPKIVWNGFKGIGEK